MNDTTGQTVLDAGRSPIDAQATTPLPVAVATANSEPKVESDKAATGVSKPAVADDKAAPGDSKPALVGDKTTTGDSKPKTAGDTKPTSPPVKVPGGNRLGLTVTDYRGADSTLCAGCGHDAVSSHIIKASFDLGIEQHRVAKLSGIGCSSKSPAYFLGRAFGFNSVHGRMPSVATGAGIANRNLILLAVSGDGDTASIGLGQYAHVIRRNLKMVYIVENNGVYGLTKGQFSATADLGARQKSGVLNELPPIDLCGVALEFGATFVARSFSGDPKQLQPLIKAALAHNGTAVIDVLSPCVTFNEHEGSTKSRQWARDNEIPIHSIGFVPHFDQINVDYDPGTVKEVKLHDGSRIHLKKLDRDFDPTDRAAARRLIDEATREKLFLTGLIYINPKSEGFTDLLDLPERPLGTLPDAEVRPERKVLDEIMESLR
ncbi:MAG: 2-oxoacid:ferredoxin oxidoreductase subunit beta [Candidatus Obscuribacterales bacterium]|nr:2-oxoacid:ferredoxin oxidoreductase subunit beta [Candidatus Obscuribacterales bacterium]